MDKYLEIPAFDQFGDPNTRVIERMDPMVFQKTAGVLPMEVREFLETLQPDPALLYLLIVALGAADYWGSNVNGDAFFEGDLLGTQDPTEAKRNPSPYTSTTLPRYKTFLSAHIFKHHVNKDPNNSFGKVMLPVYDNNMHRVLLIVAVNKQKAPDIVDDIENNRSVVWSMGTKVPFDICSICGKISKKVTEYCDHLKNSMGQILPTGQKVYAINTKPRFFDISRVLIPADRTALTLMKVASAGPAQVANLEENETGCGVYTSKHMVVPSALVAERVKVAQAKAAGETKKGDITKRVPGHTVDSDLSDDAARAQAQKVVSNVQAVSNSEPRLPESLLQSLSSFPLHQSLSSMAGLGMVASPREFTRIVICKINNRNPSSDIRPIVTEGAVKSAAVEMLLPYVADRSALSPWLEKRAELVKSAEVDEVEIPTGLADMYDDYRAQLMSWDARISERTIVKHADQLPLLGAADGSEILGEMLGMTKVAGLRKQANVLSAGKGFAPYLAAAHYQLKGRSDKPIEAIEKLAKSSGNFGLADAIGAIMGACELRL